jgi:hypothetical protein
MIAAEKRNGIFDRAALTNGSVGKKGTQIACSSILEAMNGRVYISENIGWSDNKPLQGDRRQKPV